MAFILILLFQIFFFHYTNCQSSTQDADKSREFKEKFLQNSKLCGEQYGTTMADMLALLMTKDADQSKSMCYLYCMMEKYKLMNSKGSYAKQNFKRFTETMPNSKFKTSIEENVGNCMTEDGSEKCVKAYKFSKCLYERAKNRPQASS